MSNFNPGGPVVPSSAVIGSTPNDYGHSWTGHTLTLEPADGTHGGVINTSAQTIAGVKTFSSNISAPAVYNTNGTGATDICVRVGTSTVDASVNAGAKLLSIRDGIGGTEVERLAITKSGTSGGKIIGGTYGGQTAALTLDDTAGAKLEFGPQATIAATINSVNMVAGLAGSSGYIKMTGGLGVSCISADGSAAAVCNKIGTNVADASVNAAAKLLSVCTGIDGTEVEKAYITKAGSMVIGPYIRLVGSAGGSPGFGAIWYDTASLHFSSYVDVAATLSMTCDTYISHANTGMQLYSLNGAGATDVCMKLGTSVATASLGANAKLLSIRTGLGGTEDERWALGASGLVNQAGTNTTGTPGNATVNKTCGISTIASGATTCVITNSLVPDPATTKLRISITPHGNIGTWWVVQSTGAITLTTASAVSGNVDFSWTIAGII